MVCGTALQCGSSLLHSCKQFASATKLIGEPLVVAHIENSAVACLSDCMYAEAMAGDSKLLQSFERRACQPGSINTHSHNGTSQDVPGCELFLYSRQQPLLAFAGKHDVISSIGIWYL